MNTSILPINILTKIAATTDIEEAKDYEIKSNVSIAIGEAIAKETGDKTVLFRAWEAYIMSSRKVTELIAPYIAPGRKGRTDATFLSDYGFNRSQWHRRMQLLAINTDVVYKYFDEVVSFDWVPSVAGLHKFASAKSNGGTVDEYERDCNILCAVAKRLLFANDARMTKQQRALFERLADGGTG